MKKEKAMLRDRSKYIVMYLVLSALIALFALYSIYKDDLGNL
jgi:hypothetical protein